MLNLHRSLLNSTRYGKEFISLKHTLPARINVIARNSTSHSVNPAHSARNYKRDDEISGFVVKEVTDVHELHLTSVRLQHVKTGADYLHILRNDTNNVFSVAFRTPPPNSSGMCHILEHLSLCGSKTYPCRDPFFKMLNRSVATFMNAFTGSDYTMYPFSTQNFKDYNNLMQVYLDAVFFPLLLKKDFNQEGWRLEHENVEDSNSPIILKGVVLNEMKAMHTNSAYTFHENLLNLILPTNAYKFMSGGDPQEIPNLTWEDLKNYHETYYHPSNARFFSYGDFPLESHLSNIDEWVLSKYNNKNVDSSIPLESRWSEPRKANIACFPDPVAQNPNKQTTFAMAYLLDRIDNSYESFTLAILGSLLTDGAATPFYKTLLLPGIGADYSPGAGYNAYNKQGFFSVGLTGIDEKDTEKVSKIIEETFDEAIRDGFPSERIEAILHSVELGFKHQTSNFGLNLATAINSLWNHGGNPVESLQINNHIDWFRMQLADDPSYLQKKVAQYFKENNHKLFLTMNPDAACVQEFTRSEEKVLSEKLRSLTDEERKGIFTEGIELAKYQREVAKTMLLPTLLPSELSPKIETSDINISSYKSVPLFKVCADTNGVAYFRSVLSTAHLPKELKPYLSLFCNTLTRMGAGKLDYVEQDHKSTLYTGGLSASVHVSEHPNSNVEEGIVLYSHCLNRNTEKMLALWHDIFTDLTFKDEERLTQLILSEASELVQNLSFVAHSYAMRHANSSLNTAASLAELHSGLSYVSRQKKLSTLESFADVIVKLKEISSLVLNRSSMRCAIHTTPAFESVFQNNLENFFTSLPVCNSPHSSSNNVSDGMLTPQYTHFVMPFPVNYVAKGQQMVTYTHHDYATLKVMAKLVSAKYLHREIREIGGAYGSGAALNSSGAWTFYSYRDPNVENTLNIYNRSVDWLADGQFSDQDVEEAKLQTLSEMDKPVPPGSKGLELFYNGIEDQMRQTHRDRVFSVSKKLIQDAANSYFQKAKTGVTVLGGENSFTAKEPWNVISEI